MRRNKNIFTYSNFTNRFILREINRLPTKLTFNQGGKNRSSLHLTDNNWPLSARNEIEEKHRFSSNYFFKMTVEPFHKDTRRGMVYRVKLDFKVFILIHSTEIFFE